MFLILDNNEYRRHSVLLSLYLKKCIAMGQTIKDADFYTKPNVTVYLNPTYDEIKKIKNEDTITIVAKDNLAVKLPPFIKHLPLDNSLGNNIYKIYMEQCPYGKGRELFGVLGLEDKKFAFGGKYISMTPQQLNVIKLFLYNPDKEFELYDASCYFDFNTDREVGFMSIVRSINYKCKNEGREKLIIQEGGRYRINKAVLSV